MKNKKKQENNIIFIMRICTCLLAAVSFWATAQGMINYTFPESWQAYAASLAIQGLLLGLNFALPSFLRQCKNQLQKGVLYCLTFVVLFCSSWFSYLFIAKQAYKQSWKTESQLLAQAAYREELFNSDTYIKLYSQDMQDVLMNQITDIYQQAKNMDQDNVDVSESLNWDEERNRYTGDDFTAKDIMTTVITEMESATEEDATQDTREQAASVLSGMQSNMQSEIDRLSGQITDLDGRVESAENNLRLAENRLSNAPDGVDLTPYQAAVNQAVGTYENLITRQNALERQRSDYESALQRTTYYSAILGMTEDGVSSYYVGTNLREIQRELFQSSSDTDKMLNLANGVFDRLQSAVDLGADTPEYQNVLTSMNSFIQNLENYSKIKKANVDIQAIIDKLADGSILSLERDEDYSVWRNEFNNLKSKISELPVYTLDDGLNLTTDSFNRESSIKNLDQAIRYYLTNHNDAQAGLIYLISPYREVALFSLFLAFLLDIAAFITGVIIDKVSSNDKDEIEEFFIPSSINSEKSIQNTDENVWDVSSKLNQYIFLTGDYTLMDGVITYKAIENGEQTEIEYADPNLKIGFYLWDKKQLYEIEASELLFKGSSGGPKDGIYIDCLLNYDDHMLIMTQSGKSTFLAQIGSSVPVYLLSEERYDMILSKDLSNIHGKKAVIALNKEGKQIVTIYIIE
jgi:hypothetical protein